MLGQFAEISIAMLGFSGITSAFDRIYKRQKNLSVRTMGLLVTSGIAFLASITPIVGLPSVVASIILILLVGVSASWCIISVFRKSEHSSNGSLLCSVGWLILALWSDGSSVNAPYMTTICLLLLAAALLFIRMILAMGTNGE
jgi:uncharacterized membrane protein YuzA (DUF378 family)